MDVSNRRVQSFGLAEGTRAGTKPAGGEMVLPRHADEQIVYDEPLGETLAQLCASRPLFERRAASCSFRGVDIRSLCKKGGRTDVRFSYWETALGLVPHRSPRSGDLGTPESRPTAHWFHAHHPLRFLRSELDGRNFCKPSVRRQTRAATSDSRYLPRLSSGGIDNLSPAHDSAPLRTGNSDPPSWND